MHAKNTILEQLPAATCDTSQTKPLLIANSENRDRDQGNCARGPKINEIKNVNCVRHPKVDFII